MAAYQINDNVRYEPDEHPPLSVVIGLGFQAALVIVAPIVLTVVIVVRIAGQSDGYMAWAAFAALLISGLTTILQAARVWRVGSGHILMMGTSGAFIAVCVAALSLGGPATMASLVVVSSLFQFLLAARLSWLRRIFTPVVSGTVIMLITVTVMPIVFGMLKDTPDGVSPAAAPASALVSLLVIVALVLRGPPGLRLWSPLIGIVMGCGVAAYFGMYDTGPVLEAAWIGVPLGGWPGFDFTLGKEFWALLPAFVVVTLVGAIETIGDGVAIQRVSRRSPRATDFRVVQGALNADGVGNLLSGLAGTPPNTTYSTSISLAEVTGIAARRVGIAIGATLAALAFFPKFAALLIAIPGPVVASYALVFLGLLFVQGMRIALRDGLDHRTAAVIGISFWIGAGFQSKAIFGDLLGEGFLGALLGNGMTSGAIVAVMLTAFLEFTGARRRRLRVPLDIASLPRIDEFLRGFASRNRWDDDAALRLTSAGEETLTILLQEDDEDAAGSTRRLTVTARMEGGSAQVEFTAALDAENVEDSLAYMGELPTVPDLREVSFRLLRHYASSVRHQKYHGIDIVTVTVAGPR